MKYFQVSTPLVVSLNDPLIELDDGEPEIIYESGELALPPSEV